MGKTLVFLLPALLFCIEEEMKMPVIRGEGPFALILLPSHELAIQTYELAKEFSRLFEKEGFPKIHSLLGIGGMDMSSQL
jgi:ATP-dependent RNA helicase DDX41